MLYYSLFSTEEISIVTKTYFSSHEDFGFFVLFDFLIHQSWKPLNTFHGKFLNEKLLPFLHLKDRQIQPMHDLFFFNVCKLSRESLFSRRAGEDQMVRAE